MITQQRVSAWMPYNSGGSNNWDPNASFLWSVTSKKRRKNLPLSIGRAGDQQHRENDDGSDDADWISRRRRLRKQQKPMSYASNGEEDNESFSSSLFFIPPTHDGLLQTLRFATASVKGGATSYTVWEEEVDGDDNEVKASSSKTFLRRRPKLFCFVLRYISLFSYSFRVDLLFYYCLFVTKIYVAKNKFFSNVKYQNCTNNSRLLMIISTTVMLIFWNF